MAANHIQAALMPTLSVSGNEMTFEGSWNLSYKGGAEFKFMDVFWFSNLGAFPQGDHSALGVVGSDSYKDVRTAYFPYTSRRIWGVYYQMRGTYDKGKVTQWLRGPTVNIEVPRQPTIELTDNSDGTVTIKVTSYPTYYDTARNSYREWARTVVTLLYTTSWGKSYSPSQFTVTDASWTHTFDPSDPRFGWEAAIGEGTDRRACLTVVADAAGLNGWCTPAKAERWFSHPRTPSMTKVTRSANSLYLAFSSNARLPEFPVDHLRLERLVGTDATTPAGAALKSGWATASDGIPPTDKGESDLLSDAMPQTAGTRTFYRVVAVHDGHEVPSIPIDSGLYVPKMAAKPGAVNIVSAVSDDDGASAAVTLQWKADTFANLDPSKLDGYTFATRISWSADENAWRSTTPPSSFDFDWSGDGAVPAAGYAKAAIVHIAGLTEGERVFIRARRVCTASGDKSGEVLGDWSNTVSVVPASAPDWVTLDAPDYVARGEAVPLTWLVGSDAEQTAWSVVRMARRAGGGFTEGGIIARGADANGFCTIPAEAYGAASELCLKVVASTGGNATGSDVATVRIASAPACSVEVPETVAAKPVAVEVSGSVEDAAYALSVVSRGAVRSLPDGERRQYAGDVVWAASVSPGTTLIEDAELVNGCAYDVRCSVKDPATGLASEEAVASFTVDWAHRAAAPGAEVTADAAAKSATVHVTAPAEYAEGDGPADGDVCDIYRVTPGAAYLIAEGVAFGSHVTDRFAPFMARRSDGEQAYRIATRTADGDVTWMDAPYMLEGGGIKVDWGASTLDLPFNVAISSAFAKDFEARKHLDGSVDGYWNEGAAHSGSLTTDLVRFRSGAQEALLRELARYAGAVFVRTGAGLAFAADVQVDEVSESYSSGAVGVSLTFTEVGLSDAHRCSAADAEVGP